MDGSSRRSEQGQSRAPLSCTHTAHQPKPALAPLLVPFPQSITKTRRRMYRLQSCTGTPPLVIELAGSQGTLQLPSRIRKELATSSSFAPLLPPVRSKLATSELVSFLLCSSSSSSPVGCAMATALALAAAVLLLSSTLAASGTHHHHEFSLFLSLPFSFSFVFIRVQGDISAAFS